MNTNLQLKNRLLFLLYILIFFAFCELIIYCVIFFVPMLKNVIFKQSEQNKIVTSNGSVITEQEKKERIELIKKDIEKGTRGGVFYNVNGSISFMGRVKEINKDYFVLRSGYNELFVYPSEKQYYFRQEILIEKKVSKKSPIPEVFTMSVLNTDDFVQVLGFKYNAANNTLIPTVIVIRN